MIDMRDLSPWSDPDVILETLYRVPREPQRALRAAIAALLGHDDPDIREESLRILVTRWKDAEYRNRAAEMLFSDAAPNVRSAAAYALASIANESMRSSHTLFLVKSLLDEGEEPNVRGAAYDALLILHRMPAFPTKKRDFRPDIDIDRSWVNSLLTAYSGNK
jgi:hypothetical protein